MSSKWELDDGIKSIESAWQREHTARVNLEKMLENAESENAKLRELVADMYACIGALCSMVENSPGCSMCPTNQDEERPCAAAEVYCRMAELGVEP